MCVPIDVFECIWCNFHSLPFTFRRINIQIVYYHSLWMDILCNQGSSYICNTEISHFHRNRNLVQPTIHSLQFCFCHTYLYAIDVISYPSLINKWSTVQSPLLLSCSSYHLAFFYGNIWKGVYVTKDINTCNIQRWISERSNLHVDQLAQYQIIWWMTMSN